jgi:hypothetical protein
MKKLLASLIVLVYLAVSTGFIVSVHYCMDSFDSAQLGNTENEKCGRCGMHKADGCCRDEVTVVKLQTDHLAGQAVSVTLTSPEIEHHQTNYLVLPFKNFTVNCYSVAHSPPLDEQDTYLENCVFRI